MTLGLWDFLGYFGENLKDKVNYNRNISIRFPHDPDYLLQFEVDLVENDIAIIFGSNITANSNASRKK